MHEFAGGSDDGSRPFGSLTIQDGKIYGMTHQGGDSNDGTVFTMNSDGTAFTLLHEFAEGTADGGSPCGSLTLDGTELYGMTSEGGDTDRGTIFKMNSDGSGFILLHEFAGEDYDGASPWGTLTLVRGVLYGMTSCGGGATDLGTIFEIKTDGEDFNLLYKFTGSSGSGPWGSLVFDSSMLYGMATAGGSSSSGVVFMMDTGKPLHEFSGGSEDGANPFGNLTLDSSTFYGMTNQGGDSNDGTVFKMNSDGSAFAILHEFVGGGEDGANPYGSLTLDSSTLYGMTFYGGDSNLGTIFKINTDGSNFALLHEFTGGGNDGSSPYFTELTINGSDLYGMTGKGGDSDRGTIFKINSDGSEFALLHEFAGGVNDGSAPYGSLTLFGSVLYGMTYQGGDSNRGTLFKINSDGSAFALLHEFAGGANDGTAPSGSLSLYGSNLYGMTYQGGDSNAGTVFKINANGNDFTLLHEFIGGVNDGSMPRGSLVIRSPNLYGMTYQGGDSNAGVIFSMTLLALPQDFNGDGKSDVLAENSSGNQNGYVYLMDGSTPASNGEVYTKNNSNWQIKAYADFNGDGKSDILWTENSTKQSLIYIMNGLSVKQTGAILNAGTNWIVDQVADFNGDKKADILLRESTTGDGYMFIMDGTAVSSGGKVQRGYDWVSKSCGDFNGDSKSDILWEINGKIGCMYLMNGTAVSGEGQVYARSSAWITDKFADFNGDGKCDILWKYQGGSTLAGYVYLMNGLLIESSGYTYNTVNLNWNVIQTGDLNSDGKSDLLMQNSSTGQGVGYIMNGVTASSWGQIYTVSNPVWQVKKLLDFNGDGKADILWQNSSSKKAIDYIMNGLTISATGTVFGTGTKAVVVPALSSP